MSNTFFHGLRRGALHVRAAAASLGLDAQPGTLFLVTGGGEWVVKEIALGLQPYLAKSFDEVAVIGHVMQRPYLSRANIHCLCRPAFFKGGGIPPVHSSNRLVVTWQHGSKHDREPEFVSACRQLERHWRKVERFIVPNTTTQKHVLECGVDPQIVHVIPNGIDVRLFRPVGSPEQRRAVRASLAIPPEAFVVGSFQRDEDDAGRPKLIKGPDILAEALAIAHQRVPVHALLTGPRRRFVRKRLEELGVPYTYAPQESLAELARLYHALDAYCVSSRQEGGPATIPESMVSGVPVVSTRVGLASDLIAHDKNGLVADVEDADGLARALLQLSEDPALRKRLAAEALETGRSLDYSVIARRYRDEVYNHAFA